jgi:hypothetical protein
MGPVQKALIAARDSLTPENWNRADGYFRQDHKSMPRGKKCMCAHAAIQIQVNPALKANIEDFYTSKWIHTNAVRAAGLAHLNVKLGANKKKLWNNRQDIMKDPASEKELNDTYGSVDAHFLVGMVGLTVFFNDHECKSFSQLIAKFDEAIQLAKELEA